MQYYIEAPIEEETLQRCFCHKKKARYHAILLIFQSNIYITIILVWYRLLLSTVYVLAMLSTFMKLLNVFLMLCSVQCVKNIYQKILFSKYLFIKIFFKCCCCVKVEWLNHLAEQYALLVHRCQQNRGKNQVQSALGHCFYSFYSE